MTDKVVERMARALCCPKGCAGDGERDCSYLAMTDTAQAAYDASGAKELLEAATLALSVAETWIHDQLDGTSMLDKELGDLEPVRAAIIKAQA